MIIGLDAGTKNIKVCRVDKKGDEFYDVYSAIEEIPDTVKGKKGDKIISQVIKSMMGKDKFNTKTALTSLGNSEILVRRLSLPKMPREELRGTISLQAERLIYSDLEGMDMDFYILPSEQENQMEVIFVAAPSNAVNRQMQIIQDAGIEPVIMDVDNMAMANCFLSFGGDSIGQAVVLLNIGHTKTCCTILNNSEFCFSKTIAFGGKNISAEIAKEMEIPAAKAEGLKKNPEQWDEVGLNIKTVLRKSTPDLLEAIYKSIEYCKSQQLVNRIDKMLLTGGSSYLQEIDKFFVEILGVDTQKWNPFADIKLLREKEIGQFMSVAMGLAVGGDSQVKSED